MIDQAAALRKKVESGGQVKGCRTRVITLASGKGGVGKTNITLNLGLELQKREQRVLIMDGDLGTANIDILLNMVPKYNLGHVLKGRCSFGEALMQGPGGIHILPGTSGANDLANISTGEIARLLEISLQMEKDYDILLIDIGAGVHNEVVNFIKASDEVIIVLTPEPTAITDAYSLIKILDSQHFKKKVHLIINQIDSHGEGEELGSRMERVVRKYLSLDIGVLGSIPEDSCVKRSVREQSPFMLSYPDSKAGKALKEIGSRLLGENIETDSRGMKGFVYRLIGVFNRQ